MQILKIKLIGEIYKALANINITNIEMFIESIRTAYPSTENIQTLYVRLTQIIQKPLLTALAECFFKEN